MWFRNGYENAGHHAPAGGGFPGDVAGGAYLPERTGGGGHGFRQRKGLYTLAGERDKVHAAGQAGGKPQRFDSAAAFDAGNGADERQKLRDPRRREVRRRRGAVP